MKRNDEVAQTPDNMGARLVDDMMEAVLTEQHGRGGTDQAQTHDNRVVCTSEMARVLGVHPSALYDYLEKAGFVEGRKLGSKVLGTALAVFKPSGNLILWTVEGCKAIIESLMGDLTGHGHTHACLKMFYREAPMKPDHIEKLTRWEHDLCARLAALLRRLPA
jgi:hypothetical protein